MANYNTKKKKWIHNKYNILDYKTWLYVHTYISLCTYRAYWPAGLACIWFVVSCYVICMSCLPKIQINANKFSNDFQKKKTTKRNETNLDALSKQKKKMRQGVWSNAHLLACCSSDKGKRGRKKDRERGRELLAVCLHSNNICVWWN